MRILLFIPGLSKIYNDNYWAYKEIADKGNRLLVITNRLSSKGRRLLSKYSRFGNLSIYRIFNNKKEVISIINRKKNTRKINLIISKFKPDIIICSQQINILLAESISKKYQIPIISIVEFAYNKSDSKIFVGISNSFYLKFIKKIIDSLYWKWVCLLSSTIITCNPLDKKRIKSLNTYNKPIFYVPWPSFSGNIEYSKRKYNRGIFIGNFAPHKNLKEFLITLPMILRYTSIEQFLIIGEGEDREIVEKLTKNYPDKIIHKTSVPRNEALKLIQESFFAYSPAIEGGWGFIGDS